MDKEKNIEEFFRNFNDEWDTEEPALGHQQRFLEKLNHKKKKKANLLYRLAIPAAAAVLLLLGIYSLYEPAPRQQQHVAEVSPQVRQTEVYFSSIIEKELVKVQEATSPETKVLVQDALKRMQDLEQDYDKLTRELASKGENKQIIHAMITNLQTRITFLEEVLIQIENIKKLKEDYNESETI